MKKTDISRHPDFYINRTQRSAPHNMHTQHYHDSYEIYFQTDGKRYLFHNNICHTLVKGDVVFLTPFEIHYAQSRDSSYYERYVINFSPAVLKSILPETEANLLLESLKSCIVHLPQESFALFSSLFQMLLRRPASTAGFGKTEAAALFLLLKVFAEETENHTDIESDALAVPVKIALSYLAEHYAESISLDALADIAHLSKYHFSHIFKEATGASPMRHLTNLRLSNAHNLLLHTDLRLEEIALRTGFSTYINLERAFKKAYQKTPRELRSERPV